MFEKNMKKIFIVAGELSGDQVGAWYIKKQYDKMFNKMCGASVEQAYVEAVGGDLLQQAGAVLYQRFELLNVVGIVEIVPRIPFILRFLKKLAQHILDNNFDEVILVDFPGFNVRLAKLLNQKRLGLHITYLSPPQVWCWGAWRVKQIKKFCNHVIVLYPFEVEWYRKKGVTAHWYGNPVYDRLAPYCSVPMVKKKQIALIPGSRRSEIEKLFPFFVTLVKKMMRMHPEIDYILPCAESISPKILEHLVTQEGLAGKIKIVEGKEEKMKALSGCFAAVSKPGTTTLELALLAIPTVVIYKTSWFTYFIAKQLVKVKYMALPNLLLNKPVFKEFIQNDCKIDTVVAELSTLYQAFVGGDGRYQQTQEPFDQIKMILEGKQR